MRGSGLMWLLGAGASASAGIPTAWDMIWEFKQQLYVSQRRVSLKAVADLTNPRIRTMLKVFVDGTEKYPAEGAPDEYAAFFEATYASENDRRIYISAKLSGAKPSYGHIALATLMKAGKARIVWTTNFDALVADACAKVYDSTAHLTTVNLDAPELARDVLNEERWPVEIKLHGDFRSRRLKNTNDELRRQDAQLRDLLVGVCERWGLIIAGYSGRDNSVMDTLDSAIECLSPFPGGLFWMHRGESPPLPRVSRLLERATAKGIDSGLVRIESFDETLRDLVRILSDLDTTVLDAFASEREVWSSAPTLGGSRGFPVLRLNALELRGIPSVCRLVTCKIGGHREIAEAVKSASVDILAARVNAGVIAFGNDADVRRAFAPFDVEHFDLHPIETRRLRYDSQERGLLRQALSRALAREHSLELNRHRNADLLFPSDPSDKRWQPLAKFAGNLVGTVQNYPELTWREGIKTRLDWADDRLWLLIEPRVVFTGLTDDNKAAAIDFSRERTVKRYNRQLNELVSFWAETLSVGGNELRALNTSSGVDAIFKLGVSTAYSRRLRG